MNRSDTDARSRTRPVVRAIDPNLRGREGARRVALLAGCVLLATATLTLSARLPATVAEQRGRLPPAAHCEDPVAGTWKAHAYYAHVRQWYIFTLEVKRAPSDETILEGQIVMTGWDAGPEQEQPPLCSAGIRRYSVREPARGSFANGRVVFDATSDRYEGEQCGPAGSYLLDRFSGTLDAEREEFQSVLNADSPQWRDVPTVFRRIGCAEDSSPIEPTSGIPTRPPAFQPTRSGGGCGC